ncbi:MAG: FG-GAP-like repeat-containing protein [Candidatus Angelobacter sp.]
MNRPFAIAALLLLPLTSFSQSFSTQSYPAGSGSTQLIQADFNGDHIPDLATVNNASNTVSIYINNGDGTFRAHLEFATGSGPVSLAAVDLNKDGEMDLVVANNQADAAHSISILMGNGDGTFQTHRDISGGPFPNSITSGDFNHDGNQDIATSSSSPANAVFVNLGDGKSGVLAQKTTTGFGAKAAAGENPYAVTRIVRADFNRDGRDDLYYIECCGGFDVEVGAWGVLVGNGDGTFTDHLVSTLSVPRSISAVDINQDGLSDAVIAYEGCHTPCDGTLAAINLGNGSFGQATNVENDFASAEGGSFDVEGDGLKDVLLLTNDPTTDTGTVLLIARQNADGTFTQSSTPVPLPAPNAGGSMITGDFNHDGKIDFAFIGGNSVFVSLNTTPTAACRVRTTNRSVTVCQPSDGAVRTSPARIVSHATSSTAVTVSQIYLDFKLVYQVSGGNINTSLALTPGTHKLEVKSWSAGTSFRNDFNLTAFTSAGVTPPPCTDSVNFTVNVCSPAANATVNSPVKVVAAAKSTVKITAMQIYLDNKLIFSTPNTATISTDVPMAKGAHTLVVKAWDSSGKSFFTTRKITVQ